MPPLPALRHRSLARLQAPPHAHTHEAHEGLCLELLLLPQGFLFTIWVLGVLVLGLGCGGSA